MQVPGGILEQVRVEAKALGIRGGVDKDTVRNIWNCYRGVVHLGMAMDSCEDNPNSGWHVLHLAEDRQNALSGNCPRGTEKPYVDSDCQLSFPIYQYFGVAGLQIGDCL